MRTSQLVSWISLSSVLALACTAPQAPAVPSWDLDVYPILRGSCSHCHGVAVGGLVPGSMTPATPLTRYDICDGEKFKDMNAGVAGVLVGYSLNAMMQPVPAYASGVKPVAGTLPLFIGRKALPSVRMPPPPAAPLSDYELAVIERWVMRGAPCDKLVANIKPTARVVTGPTREADRVVYVVEVTDPDGDQVYGASIRLGQVAPLEIPGAPRFQGIVRPLEIPGAGRWRLEFPASATGVLSMTLFDGTDQTAVRL